MTHAEMYAPVPTSHPSSAPPVLASQATQQVTLLASSCRANETCWKNQIQNPNPPVSASHAAQQVALFASSWRGSRDPGVHPEEVELETSTEQEAPPHPACVRDKWHMIQHKQDKMMKEWGLNAFSTRGRGCLTMSIRSGLPQPCWGTRCTQCKHRHTSAHIPNTLILFFLLPRLCFHSSYSCLSPATCTPPCHFSGHDFATLMKQHVTYLAGAAPVSPTCSMARAPIQAGGHNVGGQPAAAGHNTNTIRYTSLCNAQTITFRSPCSRACALDTQLLVCETAAGHRCSCQAMQQIHHHVQCLMRHNINTISYTSHPMST
jgi:hypothetical protein